MEIKNASLEIAPDGSAEAAGTLCITQMEHDTLVELARLGGVTWEEILLEKVAESIELAKRPIG